MWERVWERVWEGAHNKGEHGGRNLRPTFHVPGHRRSTKPNRKKRGSFAERRESWSDRREGLKSEALRPEGAAESHWGFEMTLAFIFFRTHSTWCLSVQYKRNLTMELSTLHN